MAVSCRPAASLSRHGSNRTLVNAIRASAPEPPARGPISAAAANVMTAAAATMRVSCPTWATTPRTESESTPGGATASAEASAPLTGGGSNGARSAGAALAVSAPANGSLA